MSVARMSGPQLLDAPLRPPEEPIHVQAVGVGRHLRRDPNSLTVDDIDTHELVTIEPDQDVDEACRLMEQNHLGRV